MKIIDFNSIRKLNISPSKCVSWAEEAFKLKASVKLPAKISIKMPDNIFFNTMPCYIPSINRMGIKLVSRYPNRVPSLKSDLLLYNSNNGEALALFNADWITTMRTGAVAALSINRLRSSNTRIYSFVGLGNTARATLLCLLATNTDKELHIRLLKYKDHAQNFIERFKEYKNVVFEVVNTHEDLVHNADVLVSCVTALDELFADDHCYKEGILVVPVHTRGFQNCDLFFDKVYGDDTDHIKDFKYFNEFKDFNEFSEVVINGNGRKNDKERILAYNIGIALHDVYFSDKLYSFLKDQNFIEINEDDFSPLDKFWI